MARRLTAAGRAYEQPRPPTYFGSVALAAHPFPTVSTMALHFGDCPLQPHTQISGSSTKHDHQQMCVDCVSGASGNTLPEPAVHPRGTWAHLTKAAMRDKYTCQGCLQGF